MVNNQRQVTRIFSALADPTRRRILSQLATGTERSVNEVAKPFRISLPAVSRHIRILESARLIERRRIGRVHLIRVRPEGVVVARDWLASFSAEWDRSFDKLEKLLATERQEEVSDEIKRNNRR